VFGHYIPVTCIILADISEYCTLDVFFRLNYATGRRFLILCNTKSPKNPLIDLLAYFAISPNLPHPPQFASLIPPN